MEIAAHWHLIEGRVDLKTDAGNFLRLSAMEVFQAVFSGVRQLRGVTCGDPGKELPDVTFSRYPAEPTIRAFQSGKALAVQFGVRTRGNFVPIHDDVDQIVSDLLWFPIQYAALEDARDWAKSIGAQDSLPLTVGSLIALRTRADRPVKLIDEISATSSTLAADNENVAESIPGLVADLYPYQSEGIGFLKLIAEQGVGCVLADEMGLGKTLQVIALLQAEHNAGRTPQLVVAPATLLENWRRELQKFAPNLTIHIHAGAGRPGIWHGLEDIDVTVTSYDMAIRDELLLASVPWNVIALDEAQNIKNPAALRTGSVKRLPRRVSIAVTGTPLENRVDDLWSIIDFALPGLLGTLSDFQQEFSDRLKDAAQLGELVAPVVLRRIVLEVAKDLPEKIEIPQPILMTEDMANAYEGLRQQILDEYGPTAALVAMTKLRMYCAHPLLTGEWNEDPSADMPKYDRLLEILDEVFSAGEKALIFSTFTGMADLFQRDLSQRFPTGFFRTIDGRVAVPDRQPTVDSFFSHSGPGALLLNPKAAGVGLNITAANHVIHYNPEWNPALTAQATARAYRRKQERPVTVHHLYFAGSVEEIMIQRAAFKRDLAAEAVTGHEGNIDPLLIAQALKISPIHVRTKEMP